MRTTEHHSVTLGERGRLVLPADLRRKLHLRAGDRIIVTLDPDGSLRLTSARELAARLAGLYRDLDPTRSLVDELIAERRAEAKREETT